MIFNDGQVIADGRYRVESFIAHGGMAEVWRVIHSQSGEVHALKILTPKSLKFPDLKQRFQLEFEMLTKLDHPHIVKVREIGQHVYQGERLPWFTMDFFPTNLRQRLTQVSIGEGLNLLLPILDALNYSHSRNICHRDMKPMNILVSAQGVAVLSDFGIAKETDKDRNLTGRNIIGTAYYISPEQCMGLKVTPQSDIYAFGVILYQLCTGHFPFEDASEVNIIRRHINEIPKPVQEINPDVSDAMGEAIAKCLEKKPEDRFGSALELSRVLARCPEMNEVKQRVLRPGQLIHENKYQVIGLIEQGGFAEVHRVRDVETGQSFALKICLPALAYDSEMLKRFRREIAILKAFDHPYIIKVIDSEELSYENLTLPYFVMRYFPGNLQAAMSQPVDPEKAFHVLIDVIDALGYAHSFEEGGVLHRDMKPSNILIDSDGHGYLTDFGIAKVAKGVSSLKTRSATMTRAAVGTSYYMAPEQIKNEQIDQRADLYSLGIILYELSAGRKPFDAKSSEQIIAMHLYEQPEQPRKFNERVTPKLQAVVMKCLEKKPEARYNDVPALLQALDKAKYKGRWFPSGPPIPTIISRVRRPLQAAKRWAVSPGFYILIGGAALGAALGLGGAALARNSVAGGVPSAGFGYQASIEPALRWRALDKALASAGTAQAAALAKPWSDPTQVAFLDAGEKARYDALKAAREEAAKAGNAQDGMLAEGHMRALLDSSAPSLELVAGNQSHVQTNQEVATVHVAVKLSAAGEGSTGSAPTLPGLEYTWKLLPAGGGAPLKQGKSSDPRIEVKDVPKDGSYILEASASFKEFQTAAVQFPFDVKKVTKPIDLALSGAKGKQVVEFSNAQTGGFGHYSWIIRDSKGATVAAPAGSIDKPLQVADLAADGDYTIDVQANDANTAIPAPYTGGEAHVRVDRTPPSLSVAASLGGAALGNLAAAQELAVMPTEPEIALSLNAKDNLADSAEIKYQVTEDGKTRTQDGGQITVPRSDAPIQKVEIRAYDPNATSPEGELSQPTILTVHNVGRAFARDLTAWKDAQGKLKADAQRYARSLALVKNPALDAALAADGSIDRSWLLQHAADAATAGELTKATEALAKAMPRDDEFAKATAAAQAFATHIGSDAKAGLDAARTQWLATLDKPDADPKPIVVAALRPLMPKVDGNAIKAVDETPAGSAADAPLQYKLQLPAAAGGTAGVQYRFAPADSVPKDDEKSLNDILETRGQTAPALDDAIADPTAPINLVIETTVANVPDLGNVDGQPQLIKLGAPVPVTAEARAAIKGYATKLKQLKQNAATYSRTLAWAGDKTAQPLPLVTPDGDANSNWLIRNFKDQAQMAQLDTTIKQLDKAASEDEAWHQSVQKLADDIKTWTKPNADGVNKAAADAWKTVAIGTTPSDQVGSWVTQQRDTYAKAHAHGLLRAPDPPDASTLRDKYDSASKTVKLARKDFGSAPETFTLKAGWVDSGKAAPAEADLKEFTAGTAPVLPAPPHDGMTIAGQWTAPIVPGSSDLGDSDWAKGGKFGIPPVATPTATATPRVTATATAMATATPTATPQPTVIAMATATPVITATPTPATATGAISESEASDLVSKVAAALSAKTNPRDKIFDNYAELFGSNKGKPDSVFLAGYRSGSLSAQRALREVTGGRLYFSGAQLSGSAGANQFIVNFVSEPGHSVSKYKLTLARDNGTVVIAKDEDAK